MKPKEKAEDLLNKFDYIIYTDQNHDRQVKQCALAAVCEIIEELQDFIFQYDVQESPDLYYWEEVKQEIEKL